MMAKRRAALLGHAASVLRKLYSLARERPRAPAFLQQPQSGNVFQQPRRVPATPASLVKFSASERASMTGASISTPINDHVPELM